MTTRILVVDDEKTVTEVVERYLQHEGFDVALAADGREALRIAQDWAPDLIVLDLMLPVMDGLEVCRRLRREAYTPIIMLTARGDETDRVVGLELGADDYVVKPFSPRELVARIKSVLRRTATGQARAPGRDRQIQRPHHQPSNSRGRRGRPPSPTDRKRVRPALLLGLPA